MPLRSNIKKGKVSLIIIVILWLAVAGIVFGLTLSQRVNASARLLPVYSVDTGDEKKAAITFDAAWGDETTDEVLNVLAQNGVRASFFFVGKFAEKYPESVRKICNAGHDVCNHSMCHRDPVKQDYTGICADIENCNDLLYSLTGKIPVFYRAPSGSYDNKTIEAANSLGMTAVQWNNDSIDWKEVSANDIVKRVMKKLLPGSILLFHLGRENTLAALPEILALMKEQGYEIVPLSELIIKGESFIDSNGRQHPTGR